MTDVLDSRPWTFAECTISDDIRQQVRALVIRRATDSALILSMLGLEE